METITLNLLLVAIILFGTTWGFYKIIKSGWGDSGEYSSISEKKYLLNDKDIFDILIDLEKAIKESNKHIMMLNYGILNKIDWKMKWYMDNRERKNK